MKTIRWLVPLSALVVVALIQMTAGADSGDVIHRIRSAEVTANTAQKSLLSTAIQSCLPGVDGGNTTEFACRRAGPGKPIQCRAEESVTGDVSTYLVLYSQHLADKATSRSGNNVTYTRRSGWIPSSAACVTAIRNYVTSAHATVTVNTVDQIRAVRTGSVVKSYVYSSEILSPAAFVDAQIAGTAGDIVGIVQ